MIDGGELRELADSINDPETPQKEKDYTEAMITVVKSVITAAGLGKYETVLHIPIEEVREAVDRHICTVEELDSDDNMFKLSW